MDKPFDHPEPSPEDDQFARDLIGAALTVHEALGPGFVESIYANALAIELEARDIPFSRERVVPVLYRGILVGEHRLDFLIGGRVVVELKAQQGGLVPANVAQLMSYLRATDRELGLLINFGLSKLRDGIKRVVFTLNRSS